MSEPKIIYEDENILALNKPAGMDMLAINSWLAAQNPDLVCAHRLDKDTSGVLLVAKSEAIYQFLKQQFVERKIRKKYLALVYGNLKNDSGIIDWPIGRSDKDPRRRIAGKGATGKLREALTEYRVLARFKNYSYLELSPQTGRTHQIRVHLKALGYPIVKDGLYASASQLKQSAALPIARQALHAASLEFLTPDCWQLKLESSLPADFAAALENLRKNG